MLKIRHFIATTLALVFTTGALTEAAPPTLPYPEVTVFEAAKIITMEPGYPEAKVQGVIFEGRWFPAG